MVDRFAEWALTGAVSVPAWAFIAGLVVIVAAFAFVRSGFDGRGAPFLLSALVLVAVLTGWWALDHLARRDRERAPAGLHRTARRPRQRDWPGERLRRCAWCRTVR